MSPRPWQSPFQRTALPAPLYEGTAAFPTPNHAQYLRFLLAAGKIRCEEERAWCIRDGATPQSITLVPFTP